MLISTDQNQSIPLGNMHLNSLENVVPYDFKNNDEQLLLQPAAGQKQNETKNFRRVFIIDSSGNDGRVAFVYMNPDNAATAATASGGGGTTTPPLPSPAPSPRDPSLNQPQIWFQDLGLEWHFIADSFTEYFRLLVVHLGLPHWQYLFTRVGLDPLSEQWFRFLSPERLAIDIQGNEYLDSSDSDGDTESVTSDATDGTAAAGAKSKKKTSKKKRRGGSLADGKKKKRIPKKFRLNLTKITTALEQKKKAPASSGSSGGGAAPSKGKMG